MKIQRRGFLGKLAALTGGAVVVAQAEPTIRLPRRVISSRSYAVFGGNLPAPWPSPEEAILHAFKYRNRGLPSPYWSTLHGEKTFVASYGVLSTRTLIEVVCTDWDDLSTYTTQPSFMTHYGWEEVESVAKRFPIGREIAERKVRGYVKRMKRACCSACEHLKEDWSCSISWPFADRLEYDEPADGEGYRA